MEVWEELKEGVIVLLSGVEVAEGLTVPLAERLGVWLGELLLDGVGA